MSRPKARCVGVLFICAALLNLLHCSAFADGNTVDPGNTAWLMISTALVMLMIPGVGFFYGGMVRRKNVVSMLTQSFMILGIVSIQWVVVGYSLAFGPDMLGGLIGDLRYAFFNGVTAAPDPNVLEGVPHVSFAMFQGMFAIITPALIIGAVADRVKFSGLVAFVLLWATFIYDPIAHWVWGPGGWIGSLGALDFAGGTVVHISAGASALCAALLLGKRHGYSRENVFHPHHVPMTILGASLLWFGWFGFNAGSALAADGIAANAFMVTHVAAAAAALGWMAASWFHVGKPSGLGIATGAVCGLVAITPAAGFVGPGSSIIIGLVAGMVCYMSVSWRINRTNLDDSLDVFSCHGIGGILGALLTGIFASTAVNPGGADGLLFGDVLQFFKQAFAVIVTIAFSMAGTWILFKLVDATVGLRVNVKEEIVGLDLTQHGEEAYAEVEF